MLFNGKFSFWQYKLPLTSLLAHPAYAITPMASQSISAKSIGQQQSIAKINPPFRVL
jgi:hypothetical protein